MPGEAAESSQSFSSELCGAWSVAIASIVPSRSIEVSKSPFSSGMSSTRVFFSSPEACTRTATDGSPRR